MIMGYCSVALVVGMMAISVCLWVSPVVEAVVSYGACPGGWDRHWQGSCYMSLHPTQLYWQDAVRRCNDLNGHLITPNSEDEYNYVWDTFGLGSLAGYGVWIGCTDGDMDGVWECIGDTAEVPPYRADWVETPESGCAVMSVYRNKWNDWPCVNFSRNVICERPVPIMKDSVTCSLVAADRCLLGHTFKTVTVRGRLQCCLACHKDQRCCSFNVRGNQCELNDDALNVQLSPDEKCVHYEL